MVRRLAGRPTTKWFERVVSGSLGRSRSSIARRWRRDGDNGAQTMRQRGEFLSLRKVSERASE